MTFYFSSVFPSKTILIIPNIFNAISYLIEIKSSLLISGPRTSPAKTTLLSGG